MKEDEVIRTSLRNAKNITIFSDTNRIKIAAALADQYELTENDLLNVVDCKQATLSHHLKFMSDLNFLIYRKQGKHRYYRINHTCLLHIYAFVSLLVSRHENTMHLHSMNL